ncbi:MAG TPA: hypothetical protein ENK32_02940 [Anaerolineae bacterium]|nr:hypothetical protein [Anaerolineae bacterium]
MQYGCCVLPLLHDDRLIGRMDAKMDRKSGALRIHSAINRNSPSFRGIEESLACTRERFLDSSE